MAHSFANRAALLVARDAWCSNPTTAASTYGQISTWDVSAVDDFSYVFCSASAPANISGSYFSSCNAACSSFNDDISGWDTSHGTTFESAFRGAQFFNRPLNWDTSRATSLANTFRYAAAFNQPLAWNTSRVTDMHSTFRGAAAFDQPLAWDTSQATSLDDTFTGTSSLGQCNRALIAFTFSASPAFRSSSWSSWSQDTTAGCSPSPPPSPPPPFPPTSPPYEPPPPSTPPLPPRPPPEERPMNFVERRTVQIVAWTAIGIFSAIFVFMLGSWLLQQLMTRLAIATKVTPVHGVGRSNSLSSLGESSLASASMSRSSPGGGGAVPTWGS